MSAYQPVWAEPAPAAPQEPARPPRGAFALLLVAALLHGLTCLALLPPWMGEDEPWQYEYVHHVAEGHLPWGGRPMSGSAPGKLDDRTLMSLSQLQVRRRIGGLEGAEIAAAQREILDSMRAHRFWERVGFAGWAPGTDTFDQIARAFTATHQPPLYYLVVGGGLWLVGVEGVEARLWALRGFSLLCYLAVVASAYAAGRALSRDGWIALACALFVAWLPMHARQAAVVNNDVLAKVLAALAIALGLRLIAGRGGWRAAAAMLALAALGIVTKTSTVGALAVVVPALAMLVGRRVGLRRGAWLSGLATLLLGGAAAAYWYTSHNPALPRRLSNVQHRLEQMVSPELREELGRTFAGAFRWETHSLPQAAYLAFGLGMALALAGALWMLAKRGGALDRRVLAAALAAVLLQLLLVGLRGEGKGRYLFPVLPALGALVAAGALGPLRERWRPAAFAALATLLVAYDAVFVWRGLFWSQYGPWGS